MPSYYDEDPADFEDEEIGEEFEEDYDEFAEYEDD